tara:strand:- start:42 stop:983 length:942 start_codon:yes stop_codon:yes gene_type:complete
MAYNIVIISFCISVPILIFTQRFFLKRNYTDKIISRSSHKSIATRSGGPSIFLILFIISSYFYLDGKTIYDYSFIVPLSLLVLIGLYDDIKNIDFKLKFIFQIIAAKIIIDNGLIIENMHGVLGVYELSRLAGQLLTIFIIVAIINSINFIDGIDGLALSIMIVFILSIEFFSISMTPFRSISLILIPSLITLSFFNFKKEKKIFLGDSGSHLLGGIASIYVVYVLSNDYIIKQEYDLHKILFIISVFTYPIIDMIRIFFKRLLNNKSPFEADKNHIHHLILSKTKSHFKTTFFIILFNIIIIFTFQLIQNFQ